MASEIRVDKINSLSGVGTVTLSPTGVDIAGITTAATLRATTGIVTSLTAVSSAKVGSGVTLSPDGDAFFTGVCTATSFVGSGANLTGISGVSVANQSDNRLITATGTTDALNGESGLTYDGSTLQVSGNVDLSDNNKLMIGDGDDLQIDHSGTNSQIYHNGTGSLYIAALGSGEDVNFQSTSGKMTFSTGGSERLRVTDDGIKFNGDNAAANALDDYEEGTWTPTSNVGSITVATAHYVKIGSLVYFQAYLTFPSMSGSSEVQVTGFPFDVAGSSDYLSCAVNSDANVGGAQLVGQFNDGGFLVFAKPDNSKATIPDLSSKFVLFACTIMTH